MSAAHDHRPATAPPRPAARRTPARCAVLIASTLAAIGGLAAWGPGSAWGWGRLGHRMAGRIADDRLTPAARRAVADLLEPGESLATVSTWADEVRRERKESATWHYVNVPISESKYDKKYEDAKGGVVSKIADFRKVLADKQAPRAERRDALKFLVHFVQDMHQPVHVGHRADRGGNDLQVQFFDKGSNLHSVWDSGLLEHANRPDADYVKDLEGRITPDLARQWSQGSIEDWANESLRAAQGAYLAPGSAAELRKGAKLGQAYYDTNLPVAEVRVEQAGVRLATLLNGIFP